MTVTDLLAQNETFIFHDGHSRSETHSRMMGSKSRPLRIRSATRDGTLRRLRGDERCSRFVVVLVGIRCGNEPTMWCLRRLTMDRDWLRGSDRVVDPGAGGLRDTGIGAQ